MEPTRSGTEPDRGDVRRPGRPLLIAAAGSAAVALALFFVLSDREEPASPPVEGRVVAVVGETMATSYSIKVVVDGASRLDSATVRALAEPELALVNGRMSRYDEGAEIARFNRFESTEPFPVSAETIAVLEGAREISEQTGGALDITVGPLVRLWGFHGRHARAGEPDGGVLEEVRSRVGYRLLEIDPVGRSIRKTVPAIDIDLSAIAKGYAVDRVAAALEREGLGRFLVEVGGEIRCRGTNQRGQAWRVAVEKPIAGGREIFEVVPLRDLGMATSGDYRNFYRMGDRLVSHTVDPRLGRPVAHGLASVTVVHERCMVADGLATALTVLGAADGLALAEQRGLAAMFIQRAADGELKRTATAAFDALAGRSGRPGKPE